MCHSLELMRGSHNHYWLAVAQQFTVTKGRDHSLSNHVTRILRPGCPPACYTWGT